MAPSIHIPCYTFGLPPSETSDLTYLPPPHPNHTHIRFPPCSRSPKSDAKATDVLRLVQEQSPHYKIAPWDIALLRGLSTGAVAYVTLGNTKVRVVSGRGGWDARVPPMIMDDPN